VRDEGVRPIKPIRDYFDTLVHPSARSDAPMAAPPCVHRAAASRQCRRPGGVSDLYRHARRSKLARNSGRCMVGAADRDRLSRTGPASNVARPSFDRVVEATRQLVKKSA
jgi:hypothetical protein